MIKLSPRCYNLGFIPPFCRNPFWVAKDNSSYFCKLPLDFHEHGHGYGHGEDGHSGHPQVDVHSEFHLRWVPQWQRATVRWPLILGIHCHWMNIDECRWVNKDLLSLQDSKDVDSKPFILNHWISCSTAWAEGEQLPSPTCDEMRQHWSDFSGWFSALHKGCHGATVPRCHGPFVPFVPCVPGHPRIWKSKRPATWIQIQGSKGEVWCALNSSTTEFKLQWHGHSLEVNMKNHSLQPSSSSRPLGQLVISSSTLQC